MSVIENDVEEIVSLAGRLEWDDYAALKKAVADKLTEYYNDGYSHGMFDKEEELLK